MSEQRRELTPEEIKQEVASGEPAEKTDKEYEKSRAEYVDVEIEKFVDEKIQLADVQAQQKGKGGLYKAWKKLGDMNLEDAQRYFGDKRIKNKRLKGGSRMSNVRTGISAGLVGDEE